MKIKELKALIGRAGLEHADCLDKDALLERAQTAVARLSACKTAQDDARAALVPIDPPSVVEPTEEIEYSLEERADRLLVECGLERGETVEDDVRAAAAALSIEFEDTQTTLARLEATAFGGAAASPPPQSPPRALVAAPPRALAIANDVYSRNHALALAEDDGVEDMSARELKTLVVHGGDARALVGVVEKSELRELAAAAQLALRGDKAAESSDDDFEMGETLSEEERARRAKAKAEREGNVQDISDDDSDVEDGALTPLQNRVIDYYIEYAPRRRPELGLAINAVAARLGVDLARVRAAVASLSSRGLLSSTIDEDHHKYTGTAF